MRPVHHDVAERIRAGVLRSSKRQARHRTLTAAAMTFGLWLNASSSAASAPEGPSCSGPDVVIEGATPAPWHDAVAAVLARFEHKEDLDRCSHLAMRVLRNEVVIHVVTSDGRRAERRVFNPGNLLTTVEALLIVPQDPPAPAPEPAPVAVTAALEPSIRHAERDLEQVAIVKPRLPTEHVQFELGGGPAGRVTGAPMYGGVGLGGFAQLKIDHWLISVSARWDAINDLLTTPSPSGFNMQTITAAVGLGLRAPAGAASIDVMIGPEVVVESQDAEGSSDGLGGNASDVRFDVLVRLCAPRYAAVRFFAAADLDGSPSRFRRVRQVAVGLPSLPAWSGGVQLGLVWGVL